MHHLSDSSGASSSSTSGGPYALMAASVSALIAMQYSSVTFVVSLKRRPSRIDSLARRSPELELRSFSTERNSSEPSRTSSNASTNRLVSTSCRAFASMNRSREASNWRSDSALDKPSFSAIRDSLVCRRLASGLKGGKQGTLGSPFWEWTYACPPPHRLLGFDW